jgi:hypothetical protein
VVYDAVLGISLSMMKLGNGTTMENWRGVSSDAKHVSIFSSVRTKLLEVNGSLSEQQTEIFAIKAYVHGIIFEIHILFCLSLSYK